jgi:PKD repeat protein
MKPLYTLLCFLFSIHSFAQNCCPNFINIRDSINCNHKDLIYQPGGTQGGTDVNFILPADSNAIRVCRNTKMKYSLLAYSQAPCSSSGFTIDSITVLGGILVSNSNSDFCIQWGNGSAGSVLIKFHIPGGSVGGPGCTSAILLNFILVANPIANFTIAPNPACFNNPTTINFNSSSSVGAASYFWDFGDGFTSTAINPSHAYTSPGTYTVCLTITSTSSGNGTQPFAACPSCTDSICKQVLIENLPGPDITCIASVCAGETATYCTSASCSTYNWTVIGGTIVGPDSLQCVTVQWGSGNPQGILHIDVPGCAGFCPQGTDMAVPIIPLSTNINGATIICVGSTNTYSLPSFPGTTYSWNISGGQPINGNNTNTPQIVTTWNNLGSYTITCNYYDTALNCGGVGTIVVKVLPEMKVNGPKQRCAGQNGNYSSIIPGPNTPVPCNWSISPVGASFIGGSTSVASVNINWANAGTFTLKAVPSVLGIVCDSVLYTVTVYPIPIISSITGKDTICGGSTSVYAAVSNQSGVFTWNVTGGSFVGINVNNDSVQIAWNPNGPYSITVTQLSAANNCPSLPFTKNVGVYPTPLISGPTNVCADNSVTYTISNISSGFNWYVTPAQFGTVLSAPGANPVQIKWHGNNNPGGTNTVYLHYGICGNDSIAITITEPIAPMVTATGTLCPGGVTLSTTATGTYSWSCVEHSIVPTQTLTNASITNLSLPGNYNVTVFNIATGCTTIGTYNVPDVGRPDAQIFANGSIVYCLSSLPTLPNMTLSAVNVVGYSFQWFLNNTPVGTGSTLNVTSALVNGLGSFPFKCVVTYNGCTDTSNIITISVIPCIGGFPNPFPPCGASFAITAIAGCNPFTFTLGNLNPVGSTIVSGTTSVFHYDDNSTLIGNTTKAFTSIGVKQVRICATILKPDNSTCTFCRDTTVTVTVASKFLANVSCNTIMLTDQSSVVSPAFINNYAWSVSPSGTFNNTAIASPVLTVTNTGTYTITQTVIASNGCVTSSSQVINITLPDADFNVINSCVGTIVNLSTINANTSTYWNFGDATSSATNPTSHAYATTGTFTITCSVIDAFGCKDTVKKPITIIAAPTCNITVTGLTTFCSGDSVKLDACVGFSNYQWLNNGVAISGATNMVYYATQTGNYHFTAANPSQCGVASDTISVNVNLSPSTTFSQIGSTCLGSNYSIDVPSCAGCFYIWEVDGNVEQSGASNQLFGFIGSTPFTVGPHLIKVTVLGSNGCVSLDSIAVVFNPLPSVTCSVVGNPAMLCSNNIYTLTASSSATNPSWSWTLTGFNNILSSTFSLTASVAGIYNATVTDGLTGCTNSCSQFINESPDLSLFPIGCDTLCQNETIFLPLPSVFGNLFGYTITWYDNAPPYTNIVGSGISLNLSSLALGPHNLSVIVIGPNGCADTSNVYYIYIVPSTSSVTTYTACGTYQWTVNGMTYTQSGTYTSSTINASGCPQYDTLHLIITNSTGASMADTACDMYTWNVNGNTYTQSGTYVHTTMLANGCIKSDTLFLVINKSTDVVTTIVKCGSYTWPANGVTYTASGTYSFTSLNQNGCTQYNILQLTITNAGSSTTTITTCTNSYTWPVNGITYTNSGTYVYTYLTQDSCTQTDSLILTLNTGSTMYDTISTCNFYTWNINNQTYTASGIYTHTVLNPTTGCLETYILVLTINSGVDSTLIITTCAPYTWQINGVTYTASGYYTFTTLTPQGCLSFYGLHLTITNVGEYHDTIKTCDSLYTWNVNNQTYTISGVYTHTVLDPATNCIVYYYLHLTIHPPCNTIQIVNACDLYTWDANGVTYTASGTYTHTYTNANGCVCTKTLILTIQTTTIITTYIDTCGYYILASKWRNLYGILCLYVYCSITKWLSYYLHIMLNDFAAHKRHIN